MPKSKVIRPNIDLWMPNVDDYLSYIESPTPYKLERILADLFEARYCC